MFKPEEKLTLMLMGFTPAINSNIGRYILTNSDKNSEIRVMYYEKHSLEIYRNSPYVLRIGGTTYSNNSFPAIVSKIQELINDQTRV